MVNEIDLAALIEGPVFDAVYSHSVNPVLLMEAGPAEDDFSMIVRVSAPFSELTGYTQDEVIGKTPQLLHGRVTSTETSVRLRRAAHRQKSISEELQICAKDGREIWVQVVFTPIIDTSKKAVFVDLQRHQPF
ncbi:MAG: PAS domain-containing protein [Rhodospirillaceae bacterium]|nr:PAS domain-containing protein [Rhodospirillaceae bacterium]